MEATKTHQELRAELIGKATADDGFRGQLIADPKAAVKEALGVDLPESLTVHVHEETALSAHIVLPPSASLSDVDLEGIAAGHRLHSDIYGNEIEIDDPHDHLGNSGFKI